jgi:hypothetical protein
MRTNAGVIQQQRRHDSGGGEPAILSSSDAWYNDTVIDHTNPLKIVYNNKGLFGADSNLTDTMAGTVEYNTVGTLNDLTCLQMNAYQGLKTTTAKLMSSVSTHIYVAKPDDPHPYSVQYGWLQGGRASSLRHIIAYDYINDQWGIFQGSSWVWVADDGSFSPRVIVVECKGDATTKITIHGVGSTIGNSGVNSYNFGNIGMGKDEAIGVQPFWNGLYCESAHFSSTIPSQAQLTEIADYWGTKWMPTAEKIIAGALVNLKETGILTSGANVTGWTNEGTGGAAYSMGEILGTGFTKTTINGLDCVLGNGSGSMRTGIGNTNIPGKTTEFIVARVDAMGGTGFSVLTDSGYSSANRHHVAFTSTQGYMFQGSQLFAPAIPSLGTVALHACNFNQDTTSKYEISGSGSTVGNAGALTLDYGAMFGHHNNDHRVIGAICQRLLFNRQLEIWEMNLVKAYLKFRWGAA